MSTAVPTTPPAMPPSAAGRLDEFSDKLSPMLVKELRQGLRAKTFVALFLSLQGLLAVVLLSAIGAGGEGGSGRNVSQVIFLFFGLAALVAQPLRGVGALHNEIKGNTIDLMVLTRLSSWRIVLGKWVAIVSQTALLLAAIAPYLILRYFFGRMELFAELLLLALVFCGSAMLTALTVGLSAVPSILIRGLLPLGLAIWIGAGIFSIVFGYEFDSLIQACTLQTRGSGWFILGFLGLGSYLAWMALATGASIIAPMAENHGTFRRLVALGMLALLCLFGWVAAIDREPMAMLLTLVGAPAVTIALTEPLQLLPPVCRPFLKFGAAGKLAGRFLYPGWPTGVLFTGLMLAASFAIFLGRPGMPLTSMGYSQVAGIVFLLAGVGTLLLPALVCRLCFPNHRNPFGMYMLIGVGLVLFAVILALIAGETRNDGYVWWFSWIPPVLVNLVEYIQRHHDWSTGNPDYGKVLGIGFATCSFYFAALLYFALRKFPAIREIENQAAGVGQAADPP